MKKIWFLIAGFMMGTSLGSSAEIPKTETPPKVEESNQDADKAAVHEAASEADKWAASHKADEEIARRRDNVKTEGTKANNVKAPSPEVSKSQDQPPSPRPAVSPSSAPSVAPSPTPSVSPSPSQPAKPPAPPVARQSGLNEMKGKFQSKSYDPKTLRLIVDGGYNVEFTYDSKTKMANGGSAISIEDLEYNDEVVVRYSGKELYAVEIDRVGKAPRPQ